MDYLQFYTQYELWIIGAITALLTSIVCYFVAHSNIKNYQNILVEKNKSLCELEAKDKKQNTDILVLQSENSKLVVG